MLKSIITIGLVCVCVCTPPKANAINEEWAAVAGFVGGMLFQAASQNSHVIHQPQQVVYHTPEPVYQRPQRICRPRGHWEVVQHREWVPGYWSWSIDKCGRKTRRYINGYWDYTTERVWVAAY